MLSKFSQNFAAFRLFKALSAQYALHSMLPSVVSDVVAASSAGKASTVSTAFKQSCFSNWQRFSTGGLGLTRSTT